MSTNLHPVKWGNRLGAKVPFKKASPVKRELGAAASIRRLPRQSAQEVQATKVSFQQHTAVLLKPRPADEVETDRTAPMVATKIEEMPFTVKQIEGKWTCQTHGYKGINALSFEVDGPDFSYDVGCPYCYHPRDINQFDLSIYDVPENRFLLDGFTFSKPSIKAFKLMYNGGGECNAWKKFIQHNYELGTAVKIRSMS